MRSELGRRRCFLLASIVISVPFNQTSVTRGYTLYRDKININLVCMITFSVTCCFASQLPPDGVCIPHDDNVSIGKVCTRINYYRPSPL